MTNHFLQMLLENPGDESARQIWADSLEEQGNAVDAGRLRQSGSILLIQGNTTLAFWNSLDAAVFLGFTWQNPACTKCQKPAAYSVDNDWYCTRCYIKSKTPAVK